jgi:chromosome segregation ATPase
VESYQTDSLVTGDCKKMSDGLWDISEVGGVLSATRHQLSRLLEHVLQDDLSNLNTKAQVKVQDALTDILTNEFKALATALERWVKQSNNRVGELETELDFTQTSLEIANTRAQDLMEYFNAEQQKSQLLHGQLEEAKQKIHLHQQKVLELTNSMNALATQGKLLNKISNDYLTTRKRLMAILDTSDDAVVSGQVERLLQLFVKAGEKVSQLTERLVTVQEENDTLKLLAKQHPIGLIITVLAKKREIQFGSLAEISGMNRIRLKYHLRKWTRQGSVEITKDGFVRVKYEKP